jgi:radical SAM protein with 4Fe4S-binding SPASM domain
MKALLNGNNIFLCSLHEFLPVKKDKFYIVYAPLSSAAFIATAKNVDDIASALVGNEVSQEVKDTVKGLTDNTGISLLTKQKGTIADYNNISLILNNKCNFSCSYCYSANGRSAEILSFERLHGALNYFINRERTDAKKLSITFIGGGEPMLSWPLIREAVVYALQRAEKESFEVRFKVITNGSLLPVGALDFIIANRLEMIVSFDILADIQNLQRKHYTQVKDNIIWMLEHGASVSINSVVTPANVLRQTEMVEETHNTFPGLDYLSFEPCKEMMPEIINTLDAGFYEDFIRCFFEAQQAAAQYGITLTSSVLRHVDYVVERFCPGEFGICPDGSVTACPCVSSSELPDFRDYIYGNIDLKGRVVIDEAKLKTLVRENVTSYPECAGCFIKWNCGGDCTHLNRIGNSESKRLRCDFMQKFIKNALWNRLNESYESEYNMSVMEIIKQSEKK